LLDRDQIALTGDDLDFSTLIARETARQTRARWTDIGGARVALGRFSQTLLERCERLGRVVFEPPTQHYKAGLALISWLNGWQDVFALVADEHRQRSLEHCARVAELASDAGCLVDAELAAERLSRLPSWLA
jgi:hypothetical protein